MQPNTIAPLAKEDEYPAGSSDPRALYFIPSAAWITGLNVGDMAQDVYGRMCAVVSIEAQRDNIHGDPFICLYTHLSSSSRMSGSFTAGKLHRSLAVTRLHTSHQLDKIEKEYHDR
jgi:hypothetical protein